MCRSGQAPDALSWQRRLGRRKVSPSRVGDSGLGHPALDSGMETTPKGRPPCASMLQPSRATQLCGCHRCFGKRGIEVHSQVGMYASVWVRLHADEGMSSDTSGGPRQGGLCSRARSAREQSVVGMRAKYVSLTQADDTHTHKTNFQNGESHVGCLGPWMMRRPRCRVARRGPAATNGPLENKGQKPETKRDRLSSEKHGAKLHPRQEASTEPQQKNGPARTSPDGTSDRSGALRLLGACDAEEEVTQPSCTHVALSSTCFVADQASDNAAAARGCLSPLPFRSHAVPPPRRALSTSKAP